MPAFEIFSGENLIIQVPIYVLEAGWTWKGVYDPLAAYVIDDALLGLDNIGYHVTANVGPGVPPPNASFYEVLDPVPAESISSILMQLVGPGDTRTVVVSWSYRMALTDITTGPLTVDAAYIIRDYNAGDDFTNVGASGNTQGLIFTATGDTPATWTNGSLLRAVTKALNFQLTTGQFIAELIPSDSLNLDGLYEIRIAVASLDGMYIATGAQTDVLCIPEALQVTPC